MARVRIKEHLRAPDGSYSYYPGQIIIDHPDEARWLSAGVASLEPLEVSIPAQPEAPVSAPAEISKPLPSEIRQGRRR